MSGEISLRDAREGDYQFLYNLHCETLKEPIDRTWGWDEDWQANHFRKNFDISGKKIIQQDGVDIGCLAVQERSDHLFLSYIALMPPYQGQGIGSMLIEGVLDKALARGMPIELRVLRKNPAHVLYKRLGFRVFQTSETHFCMRFDP